MADVTLVLDNADGLLPVDFQVLELGRRLYRSGENDYLLNKQRIRLRDLVDLLDAAHLADNAFLFIGQGMVDQALALRPEERRPLFEEVAGVRRHERRRRKAEEQLVESEVEPRSRRGHPGRAPAAGAPARRPGRAAGHPRRRSATSWPPRCCCIAHARWHEASTRGRRGDDARRARPRPRPTAAMADLTAAEAIASARSRDALARERLASKRERREGHDLAARPR